MKAKSLFCVLVGLGAVRADPILSVGATFNGQYADPTVSEDTASARIMLSNGTLLQFSVLEGFIGSRLVDATLLDYPLKVERSLLTLRDASLFVGLPFHSHWHSLACPGCIRAVRS